MRQLRGNVYNSDPCWTLNRSNPNYYRTRPQVSKAFHWLKKYNSTYVIGQIVFLRKPIDTCKHHHEATYRKNKEMMKLADTLANDQTRWAENMLFKNKITNISLMD